MTGLVAITSLVVAACGSGASVPPSGQPGGGTVPVVTSTTILADLTKNVGGDGVEVRSIVPPGADVHTFNVKPGDSATISRARMIVLNGGGLDSSLEKTINSSKQSNAVVIVASEGLKARPSEDEGDVEGDPHFWLNPRHAMRYVERIRDGLAQVDPARAEAYRGNAEIYVEKLRQLDGEIEQMLRSISQEHRRLVSFHNAFGYFAERYGFEAFSLVRTESEELTPATVAKIIERIRAERIPAVFSEPQFSQDLIGRIARDAGVGVGVLSDDALTAAAPTYIDLMRANVRSLLTNLGQR